MNILMIGNGFDLEHDLPTQYADFLKFVEKFELIYCRVKDITKELCTIDDEYLKLIFERQEYRNRVDALHIFTDNNIWIYYFKCAYKEHLANRENWVDFESEISDVIQSMDALLKYYMNIEKGEGENKALESFYRNKLQNIGNFFSAESIIQKIPELLLDLDKLIGALEIYMWDYIGSKRIQYYNPDIAQICPDKVLSFNYSDTYKILYAYNQKNIDYSYIHGKAENNISFFVDGAEADKKEIDLWIQKNADLNNMVLGIDEYLEEERRSRETDFIAFKKYYQRIYKKNGNKYKKWLAQINKNVEAGRKEENILYIFGHSLDETDGDVLREFITHKHIRTVVYYRNKRQLGQQIANLVKILKSDKMIEMVYGNQPRITFQEQSKRELIKGSPFEIASDTMQLSDVYKWDDLEAEVLLKKIDRKIKQNDLDYFQSQRAVITLFDALQKNGLAGRYAKKLLSIAYSLMKNEGIYEAEQYDSEDWAYQDYDDCFGCDSFTAKFIDSINAYNRNTFTIEENLLKNTEGQLAEYQKLIRDKIELDREKYLSVINNIFGMFHDRHNNIEDLWNILLRISRGPGEKVAKSVLKDKLKSSKDVVEIVRCNHLLSEIQMSEYFDMRAEEYQNFEEDM